MNTDTIARTNETLEYEAYLHDGLRVKRNAEQRRRRAEASAIKAAEREERKRQLEERRSRKVTRVSMPVKEYREWIDSMKRDTPCTDCGNCYPPIAMGFDHLPEFEKSFNITSGSVKGREVVLAELAKCELVCHNCHAIRTDNRRKK
jgi:hypothetical protein